MLRRHRFLEACLKISEIVISGRQVAQLDKLLWESHARLLDFFCDQPNTRNAVCGAVWQS